MPVNFCSNCGQKQSAPANFCPSCGESLTGGNVQKSTNSRQQSRRSSKLDAFVEEAIQATRGRSAGKTTQIEYTNDEVRKGADSEYRENLSALIVALGMELKGGEL